MNAKITSRDGYRCAPNGYKVEFFPFGAIVSGQVAKWAIEEKCAAWIMEKPAEPVLERKVVTPEETKPMPDAQPKRRGRPRKDAE